MNILDDLDEKLAAYKAARGFAEDDAFDHLAVAAVNAAPALVAVARELHRGIDGLVRTNSKGDLSWCHSCGHVFRHLPECWIGRAENALDALMSDGERCGVAAPLDTIVCDKPKGHPEATHQAKDGSSWTYTVMSDGEGGSGG